MRLHSLQPPFGTTVSRGPQSLTAEWLKCVTKGVFLIEIRSSFKEIMINLNFQKDLLVNNTMTTVSIPKSDIVLNKIQVSNVYISRPKII